SEFVEMFVGVGASRVRDLFDRAKAEAPAIVFVDEIDAVGRHRGSGLGGSHDEREQTLNQILVEMDGFDTDTNIIIIAATNRPDILDPALLRPGRFDRRVVLDRPDMRGREAILKVHTRGKPLSSDVEVGTLARSTPGFVGADLENLVNEAAILAARKNRKSISMRDFEEATERVALGPERKSRVISPVERRTIAYHEAGHAIVMHLLPESEMVVRKITIIPRGMAGGVTWSMPTDDANLGTFEQYRDNIAGMLGGRAAEEIALGRITNGAANDLERVTQLSRTMLTRWGMNERLGLRVFGRKEEMIFLGREISEERDYSERVAEVIDEEVHALVQEQYERAKNILIQHRDKLDLIAERLLEVESLSREEFLVLMGENPDDYDEANRRRILPPSSSRTSGEIIVEEPPIGADNPPKLGSAPSPA
ncbi:MAG: AAA family ATPase, partial [Anaerolineae bacterium]|nr:AAA family ATPase [Anaerolineae bacterium]